MTALAQTLVPSTVQTKIRTSFRSLAICDALGAPVEFHLRGTFPTVDSMLPNENFQLGAGYWTDDTTMALCLASSILEKGKSSFDIYDQARRYSAWVSNGYMSSAGYCFDIGNATASAIQTWDTMGFDEKGLAAIKKSHSGARFSGNGSLMRVLPVALAYYGNEEEALKYAQESSLPTHPNAVSRESCKVYVKLVSRILRATRDEEWSLTKGDLLEVLKKYPYETEGVKGVVGPDSNFIQLPQAKISSSGYVLNTLQAALWVFFNTSSFEEGAIHVVNLGDDADTVAAVYGGIAGAWYADTEYEEAKQSGVSRFWTTRVLSWYGAMTKKEVVGRVADGLAEQ